MVSKAKQGVHQKPKQPPRHPTTGRFATQATIAEHQRRAALRKRGTVVGTVRGGSTVVVPPKH